jgi:hypothetical protein
LKFLAENQIRNFNSAQTPLHLSTSTSKGLPESLPPETICSIFELCSKDTLANLALVNSVFNSIAIRVLYRTVSIVSVSSAVIRLLLTLSSNETIARAVRFFSIRRDRNGRFQYLSSFYNILRSCLRCLTKIARLNLTLGGSCGHLLTQTTFRPTSLFVLGDYDGYLDEFLRRHPQLQSLTLYTKSFLNNVSPSFAPATFPSLTLIDAPARFVAAACPGCPITNATVNDNADSLDLVDAVSMLLTSSKPVRIMNIIVGSGDLYFDPLIAGLTKLPIRVLMITLRKWNKVRTTHRI